MTKGSEISRRQFVSSAISAATVASIVDLSLSSERKLASTTAAAGTSTGSEWKNQGVLNLVKSPYAKLRNVPVHAVTVTSGFWAARRDGYRVDGHVPQLGVGRFDQVQHALILPFGTR